MRPRVDEIAELKKRGRSPPAVFTQSHVRERNPNINFLLCSLCLCGLISLAAGCSDNTAATQPSTLRDRQDVLLRDPFSDTTSESVDVSGGKINELDRKALKRDLNNVFNP